MPEATELSVLPFGRKTCDLAGYEACWVQFKTSGYPRKLRKEWDATTTADSVWSIVGRYLADWHLVDLAGQAVPVATDLALLDDVEDALVTWVINTFSSFWLTEATVPRPNSLLPSATTPTA